MDVKIRKSENVHILLWLLKDLCWVADFKIMGLVMIVPTIAVAIYITVLTRRTTSEFFHNLAVVCWICANSVWMIGEFYLHDTTRIFAMIFFIAGIALISGYYGSLLVKRTRR